jgi:CO/xanthine dehydrogenase Mo-binding subunit
MNVEAQLEGGATQGLGYALYEDFVMDTNTGSTVTDNFTSYKIPTSVDVPEIETIIVEEGTPSGPFGAKGVGEAGMVNVAAAIANALYDAVGIRITRLPITPEKIVEGLKSRKAK